MTLLKFSSQTLKVWNVKNISTFLYHSKIRITFNFYIRNVIPSKA